MAPVDPSEQAVPARLTAALAAIDAANAQDPNVIVVHGEAGPKELVHSRMMTAWLERLDPVADELQHLAARAHHFRRWSSPRSEYPTGRSGYLRWRTAARRRHAEQVQELLAAHGYTEAEADRVGDIIRKVGLGTDAQVQVHEDALCLVFLETQLSGVADQLGADATVEVLVRTVPKMSPAGLRAASGLDLDASSAELLAQALARTAEPTSDAATER